MHKDIPFDDLSESFACKEAEIILYWIRVTLDWANEGSFNEEALDTATLTEFFGPYSHTAKGLRTLAWLKEI